MSRIDALKKDFSLLPDILAEYDDALEKARGMLPIAGKTLATTQKEQCGGYAFFDERRAELKTLVKFMNAQVEKVRGELTRRYVGGSRDMGERLIAKYIDSEPEYLSMYELLLEVEEVYDKYTAVVEAFTKRGYALKDLTAATIAEIHNITI